MSVSAGFQNAGSGSAGGSAMGPSGFQGSGDDPNSGTDVKPVSIFSNDYKK